MGGNPSSTYLPLHPGLNSGNVSLKSRVLENNGGMTGAVVLVRAGIAGHTGLRNRGYRGQRVVVGRRLAGLLSIVEGQVDRRRREGVDELQARVSPRETVL